MSGKRPPEKAPAEAGADDPVVPSDLVPVSLMFDEVGDFSPRGVEAMNEAERAVRINAPELLRSFEEIFAKIDGATGLTTSERYAILDCVFSIQETSSAIQVVLETFLDIYSYRFKHRNSFTAKSNAKKRAASDPKSRAMRAIEKAWDEAGRPDAGKFATDQARDHQLQGIEITQGGIYNALKRHEKKIELAG